jgi:hypothetical protein
MLLYMQAAFPVIVPACAKLPPQKCRNPKRFIDDAVLAAEIKEVFHEHKGRMGRRESAVRSDGEEPDRARSGWLD